MRTLYLGPNCCNAQKGRVFNFKKGPPDMERGQYRLFAVSGRHFASLGIDQMDAFTDDAGHRLVDVAVLVGRIIGNEALNPVAGGGTTIEESGGHGGKKSEGDRGKFFIQIWRPRSTP